ncbi:MAG: hypothetical protein ABIN96_06680 [Rubrivivax sp.]
MNEINHPSVDNQNASRIVRDERQTAHGQIDQAAEKASSSAHNAIDKAGPAVDKAVRRGGEMAHAAVDKLATSAERSATWVRANGEKVRAGVDTARYQTAERVRQDPIKSVLMAAAAGAVLYALLHAFSGNDR